MQAALALWDLKKLERAREDCYWRLKWCKVWLKEDDQNMKFFRNTAKMNRNWNKTTQIQSSNGCILSDPSEIHDEGVKFFKSLLDGDSRAKDIDCNFIINIP